MQPPSADGAGPVLSAAAPKPSYTIGSEDFEMLCCVGSGSFGKVFQVRHRTTRQVYAMKIISKDLLQQTDTGHYVQTEKDIMTKIFLVLDYMPGGELFGHLEKQGTLLEAQARIYIAEVILAVGHLHDLNIIHRDLKPENILLQEDCHLALTDFGFARYVRGVGACPSALGAQEEASSLCGTNQYLAPEIVLGGGYGMSVDWWSIGALLFELLTGKAPFSGKDSNAIFKRILTQRMVFPNYLSGSCVNLLKGLLFRDQNMRLGSARVGGLNSIKSHSFFKGLDWDKLYRKEITPPITFEINKEDHSYFDQQFTTTDLPYFSSPSLTSQAETDFPNFSFIHHDLLPPLELDSSVRHTDERLLQSDRKPRAMSLYEPPEAPHRSRASSCLTIEEGMRRGYRNIHCEDLRLLRDVLLRRSPAKGKSDWVRRLSVDELDIGFQEFHKP